MATLEIAPNGWRLDNGSLVFAGETLESAQAAWDEAQSVPPADDTLTTWRGTASASRVEFGLRAMATGLIDQAEFEGWISRNGLPGVVMTALDGPLIPNGTERMKAWAYIMDTPILYRASEFIALMQASMGLTDDQVDALFPGAPA